MECNKDEAARAKEIAEKKMQSNDFEGARKFALKAKNLYPELENITQMLSICDVHCSAQRRLLGSEKDWYGILQVEKLADESTVKKQYRRLALILHPDKNRFPGAEGAFKLISEANALLSDQAKKVAYDNKIRVLSRSAAANPPNLHINRSSQFNKQYSTQNNNISNGFSGLYQQATQLPSFWTCCPFCSTSFQYLRQYVKKSLVCQKCTKGFVAYEVSAQGVPKASKLGHQGAQNVPSKPNMRQQAVFQEKVVTNQENSGKQNAKVPSTSHAGSQGTANKKTVQPQPGMQKGCGSESIKVAGGAKNLKTKETANRKASSLHGEKEDMPSNGDAIHRDPRNARNKNQKRKRKFVLGSGNSSESEQEDLTEQENLDDAATDLESEFIDAQFARRSSRRRQNVSYKETDEDDHAKPLKRAQTTKEADGKEQKDVVDSEDSKHGNQNSFPTAPSGSSKFENEEMEDAHSEESLKNKNEGCEKEGKMGEVGGKSSAAADTVEVESDSDLDWSFSTTSDTGCFECPDPEFSDFDKLRDESLFNVNQYWACYDTLDGMPRFYAKVTKVHPSPFELQIKWLEAVPINDAFEDWVYEELPVGCGNFKLGKPDKILGCLTLSHQVHCERGKKKNSFIIYPRQGEVWALLRDWDVSWSSNPKNHKEFSYEIVEVLSDFSTGVGIKVDYLDKVTGFVSLFQKASPSETSSFVIGPTELYKFSHCVPSFKMTGTERDGVPKGSFELDPASLPLNPDHLYFPSKENIGSRNKVPTVSSALPKYAEGKGKSVASGGTSTPHKIVDLEGTGDDATKFRRSPRGVNVIRQNTNWCNRVVPPTTSVHQDW
ncbi:hypothetical protein C2S53_019599 [Perilla frutescens var. hirtella]|uniref:J domain-containing protein n=1 Tax=Perilla frutescens var. hirtella TaxID=608512 RepID=A0AAD4PA24_PERFH|nr:hypothetical protein C2S53_019599 [Perilla frutescens var. hirtella]